MDGLGGLLIVAHPFRGMGVLPDPKYLHGAEAFNSNPRNQNHNEKSYALGTEPQAYYDCRL